MTINRRFLLVFSVLIGALVLVACGGAPAETGGGAAEEAAPTGGEEVVIPEGALAEQEGVRGTFYAGPVSPPSEGMAFLYVHEDTTADLLLVVTNDDTSMWMTGNLEGQRVNAEAVAGEGRAAGRVQTGGDIEFNITFPGRGFVRTILTPTEGGALYACEGDCVAAAGVMPDGTAYGVAASEEEGETVYQYLCIDEPVEGIPEELTATICDTDEEITLTLISD